MLDEFNWALDWFDVIAAEYPDRPALRILSDDGSDVSLSYGSLSERSSQVAGWLRGLGVARGDRVLLMLGNVALLWEYPGDDEARAAIIPASTPLQPADLVDRVSRGRSGTSSPTRLACRSFPRCPATGRGSWSRGVQGGWHLVVGASARLVEP